MPNRLFERYGLWPVYWAMFYPAWWLAQAVVGLGPALLAWRLHDAKLMYARADWSGVFARTGRAADGSIPDQELLTLAALGLGWGVWMLAAWRLERWRAPFGYLAVLTAFAGFARGVGRALSGGWSAPEVALALAGWAGLALAARRLPVSPAQCTGLGRFGCLLLSVMTPLVCWDWVLDSGGFRRDFDWEALVVAATALLAAGWRRPEGAPEHPAPWVNRAATAAAAVAVLCIAGSGRLDAALQGLTVECQTATVPLPAAPPLPEAPEGFFYKGVNFTAEWPDPYGSEVAGQVLAELVDFGVNTVALVPYAAQRPDETEISSPLRMERGELIARSAAQARAVGLRVLLKPQVWVRGPGLYPGDLHYDDPADRARWFASYRTYILGQAELAREIHADMFCVGVEFAQLSDYEDEWRSIIAAVREIYDGPLVYAANFGEEFESVQFWDALDYIGLDNYYPMTAELSIEPARREIEAVYRRWGKPILFTEAGFTAQEMAWREPWATEPGGAFSPEAQARFYEAFLEGYYDAPWLAGVFWWKVGTAGAAGPSDGSHMVWGRPAMGVVKRFYTDPDRR